MLQRLEENASDARNGDDGVHIRTPRTDIPARDIGLINIYDKFTFVEVPEDVAEKVIGAMNKNFIKGYKVNIEPAKARR